VAEWRRGCDGRHPDLLLSLIGHRAVVLKGGGYMATPHVRKPGRVRASPAVSSAVGSIALLLTLPWSTAALAQPGSNATTSAAGSDIMIHSSVAGATPWAEPGPATTVPGWAEQSYRIYLQMKARAHGGTVYTRRTIDRMPDWTGLWIMHGGVFTWDGNPRGIGPRVAQGLLTHCWRGDTPAFPCQGWLLAALTPQYALKYRDKLEAVAHDVEWDPLSDCLPQDFPRIMIDPVGNEFIDTPKETWITSQTLNEIRRIYTDGRGHMPRDEAYPLWDGDSIGFWDGDTLVVHTLYTRADELQRVQPALSDETSVIERIRMTGPNTIVEDATIYDPLALREPWHGVHTYVRITTRDARMDMYGCDPNVYQGPRGGTQILLPGESVTLKRSYRDPDDDQNYGVDKVRAYGAELLRRDATTGSAH